MVGVTGLFLLGYGIDRESTFMGVGGVGIAFLGMMMCAWILDYQSMLDKQEKP